jgi:hypothetical protein
MEIKQRSRKLEYWIIFILSSSLYMVLGARLIFIGKYLPTDGIARLVNAYLVFYGSEIKLATIGFIWPPLPTLFLLPFAIFEPLVYSWTALTIVSALAMGVSIMFLNRLGILVGLQFWWRLVMVFLFATNPLILLHGANGMSEAIGVMSFVAAFYYLIAYWKKNNTSNLVLTALFFGLLPIIRYELLLFTIAGGLLVMFHIWSTTTNENVSDFRNIMEGKLLAYAPMAIYPIFLWSVANWEIMGNMFYFLSNDRSSVAVTATQIQEARLDISLSGAMTYVFNLWLNIYPLVLLVLFAAVVIGVWKKSAFMVLMGLISLIIPLSLAILLARESNMPLPRYYIIAIPLSVITMLCLFQLLGNTNVRSKGVIRSTFILGMTSVMAISNISTFNTLQTIGIVSQDVYSWRVLIQGDLHGSGQWSQYDDGFMVGQALVQYIEPGKRILMDTYGGGYAVILGTHNPRMFIDSTDPNFEQALRRPWEYADYVLIPDINVADAGALNRVNQVHRTLYEIGAAWAELVPFLPASAPQGWRLYKINHDYVPPLIQQN